MQILLNCKQHFLIFPGILSDKHKNSIQFDHSDTLNRRLLMQNNFTYLAIQIVQTSLGPCLSGHNTWVGWNETLPLDFSLDDLLNFDVAFLEGTLKSLDWCVNSQLLVFTQRGLRMLSSATLLAVWSAGGDKRELRRLGCEDLFGDWLLILLFFFASFGESGNVSEKKRNLQLFCLGYEWHLWNLTTKKKTRLHWEENIKHLFSKT